nr:unnamed protein product [Callosobruchus chinensis]
MLLALTTGHRSQTLINNYIDNINIIQSVIYIKVSGRFKTSGLNKPQPLLSFKIYHECPELCIASTFKHYIEKTQPLYGKTKNEKYLFRP